MRRHLASGGGGGGGRGDSHINRARMLVGNFEKSPKRYQDPVLWAWHEIFFTPERYHIMGFN